MKILRYKTLLFSDSSINFQYENCMIIKYTVNFQEFLYELSVYPYDILVLALTTEAEKICRLLRIIRKMASKPIVVCMEGSVEEKMQVIYAGADEIIETNRKQEDTFIRIYSLMQRYKRWSDVKENKNTCIDIHEGKLMMERKIYEAYWNGQKMNLTRQEYDFLYLLASAPRRIYTFEQIYQLVWKDYPVGDIKNIIWCLVKRLRKKLNIVENDAGNCIVSVRDVGYKFELNNENEKQ